MAEDHLQMAMSPQPSMPEIARRKTRELLGGIYQAVNSAVVKELSGTIQSIDLAQLLGGLAKVSFDDLVKADQTLNNCCIASDSALAKTTQFMRAKLVPDQANLNIV